MLADPLYNRRFRHREQTIHQMRKGAIFLRQTAHVASMIAPLVVAGSMTLVGAARLPSQQPPPSGRESERSQPQAQPARAQQQPTTDPRGTEQSPVVVKIQPALKTDEETAKEKAEEDKESSAEWWTLALAVSTGAVGLLQLALIGVQARIAARQNKIIESQNVILRTQSDTLLKQQQLMKATLTNTQDTDRAWISIETLEIEPSAGGRIVFMGLKNSGRTPARISSANVTIRSTTYRTDEGGGTITEDLPDLPDDPDYDLGDFVPPAILVAGETTRWKHDVTAQTGGAGRLLTIAPGDKGRFWIYGKVEYTDQFHPSQVRIYKWGREYDPAWSKREGRFKFAHLGKKNYSYAD